MRARQLWWSVSLLLACSDPPPTAVRVAKVPAGVTVALLRVEAGGTPGLSGSASDAQGQLWAVAERERSLVRLRREGGVLKLLPPVVSLVRLPKGVETEALAWLGDNRFILGTETDVARTDDSVIVIRVDGAQARVEKTFHLNYASVGMTAADNAGIECACAVGDRVLLGVEQRLDGGEALVARLDTNDGSFRPWRLRLTTRTGKLAAFDCVAAADGGIEVIAIERHYAVARVLSFHVADDAPLSARIVPRVLLDLAGVVEPQPNWESIARVGDDIVLISDNHHGGVTGPTVALWIAGLVPPRGDQKR